MFRVLLYTIFLLFTLHQVQAQQLDSHSNKRWKKVKLTSSKIKLDSLTIAPSSVSIKNSQSDSYIDSFVIKNNYITFPKDVWEANSGDTLLVTYRTFDFNIAQRAFHLHTDSVNLPNLNIAIGYNDYKPDNRLIQGDNLQYNGAFSRGFSVGNAQSLVLNSNFNLQLAGDLGNGLQIAAAISDDNIPIQPEGNTQVLREFDRVYIEVSKDRSRLLAGDFQLGNPTGHFTRYQKKLQGLSFQNTYDINDNLIQSSDASIAVSRGKFHRYLVPVLEGNQGPYRLPGAHNERNLIVLSGTEKVYLDGRLLVRGFDYDYVIDYDRAEISFTPTTLIRKESRIIVEYEYTDQNYLRTLYAANTYLRGEKYGLNLNLYSEQDSKTATTQFDLDTTNLAILNQSGDDPLRSVRSGIVSVTDTSTLFNQLTYAMIPVTILGDTITFILEYSDDYSLNLVQAQFSDVGMGSGRYIIDNNSVVNGRVYRYVGMGNGSYEPVINLIAPEQKQLVSLGGYYNINKRLKTSGELSLSRNDINRLSSIDDEDNLGWAGYLNLNHTTTLKKSTWQNSFKLESTSTDYQALNPYRSPEFSRDWNIYQRSISDQRLIRYSSGISLSDSLKADYTYNYLSSQNSYNGHKHQGNIRYINKVGTSLISEISRLSSKDNIQTSDFSRMYSTLSQSLWSVMNISLRHEREQNLKKPIGSDLLTNQSLGYDLYRIDLKSMSSKKSHYNIYASLRKDHRAEKKSLTNALTASELGIQTLWNIAPSHNIEITGALRDYEVTRGDLLLSDPQSKTTITGRLQHQYKSPSGFLLTNTSFTTNGGQQPKIEYFFERVPVGQGEFVYIGNEDSTLVNANFRYAPELGTANYVRFSLYNNEFVATQNQTLAHSLRINPSRIYKGEDKSLGKRLFSRLSTLSTVRIDKNSNDSNGDFQVFNLSRNAENIIRYNSRIVNTLFINKGRRAFDIQLSHSITDNIFTQVSGLEVRSTDQYLAKTRIQIIRNFDLNLEASRQYRSYDSELFPQRNIDLLSNTLKPSLRLRLSRYFELSTAYSYTDNRQRINNMESACNHEVEIDASYRKSSSLFITANVQYVQVDYTGEEGSIVEFDILQGLKDGSNLIWQSLFTKRLSNNIDLSFSYQGRKNQFSKTVHRASIQAKATF